MSQNPNVKQWLSEHGLTQAQLAELLPVSLPTVQAWCQERFSPPEYLWRALRDLANELPALTPTPRKRKARAQKRQTIK